eukprot:CAMPEP_0204567102 /NCGR_PEP_ID=MMETSP0661-20131031/36412_1 /ASSEMBLY_ACC=CAM_ASM_000606 /TAXON_ID=109239 /ORGANISM="Alexandrium margalefi, Strain AMGDE01CS-322" /LENGTH=682 /DNA_ID=CAMNT_0051574993 /DNA_START=46 /DNA_END=2094 /DNA_ORIENTATION=-
MASAMARLMLLGSMVAAMAAAGPNAEQSPTRLVQEAGPPKQVHNGTHTVTEPARSIALTRDEQYLAPYVQKLLDYRTSPISRRYIWLANLVAVLPTWLDDLYIRHVLSGSKLTIPLNLDVPISIPLGPLHLKTPAVFHAANITLSDLTEFKELAPLQYEEGSMFTWHSEAALRDFGMVFQGGMELEVPWAAEVKNGTKEAGYKDVEAGKEGGEVTVFDVKVTMKAVNPSASLTAIVAMDHSKVCETWGEPMRSSVECALYPIFFEDGADATPVSGLNVTRLQLSMRDYTLAVEAHSVLGDTIDRIVTEALNDFLDKTMRQKILDELPTVYSQRIRDMLNQAAVAKLPTLQPCVAQGVHAPAPRGVGLQFGEPTPRQHTGGLRSSSVVSADAPLEQKQFGYYNASEICVVNNGAFALRWAVRNCPLRLDVGTSPLFPADQTRCVRLSQHASSRPGHAVRVQMQAIAGVYDILDPTLRYQPDSNVASFVCHGSTLSYQCDFTSLVPVNPSNLPRARRICVLNQAGFDMYFVARNTRTGATKASGTYPIMQMQCIDLGTFLSDSRALSSSADDVEQQDDEKLPPESNTMQQGSRGLLSALADAGPSPQPHQHAPDDTFEAEVHAILGRQKATSRNVIYDPTCNLDVTFVCRGTSLNYSCTVPQQLHPSSDASRVDGGDASSVVYV